MEAFRMNQLARFSKVNTQSAIPEYSETARNVTGSVL